MRATPRVLGYLTVFQSRLGLLNLVLMHTEPGRTGEAILRRRIERTLRAQVSVGLPEFGGTRFQRYFAEKRLIGSSPNSSGRYRGWSTLRTEQGLVPQYQNSDVDEFPMALVDYWLSDPRCPSSVGVPTAENLRESIDFSLAVDVLSRTRWSPSGLGASILALRQVKADDNPFVLGLERCSLLRALLMSDGEVLVPLLEAANQYPESFSRDEIATQFPEILREVFEASRRLYPRGEWISDFKRLLGAVERSAQASESSGGPGVLEHRVSPRLEWLVDLGFLAKPSEKNSFRYEVSSRCRTALEALRVADLDESVVRASYALGFFDDAACMGEGIRPVEDAVLTSYRSLASSVGAVAISEVAFVAACLLDGNTPVAQVRQTILELAGKDSRVTLVGGRYDRSPRGIHVRE